jgi:hypothetical protein
MSYNDLRGKMVLGLGMLAVGYVEYLCVPIMCCCRLIRLSIVIHRLCFNAHAIVSEHTPPTV